MRSARTNRLILCAFFAALSAALSQIVIPIGPVPIVLTHISIFMSVGLLGVKYGVLSQVVFVFTGAVGIPVFHGFSGGMGVIFGPTGGFIAGYVACAFVTGILISKFGTGVKIMIPAMCAGWVATYSLGIPWFMYVTNMNLQTTLLYMAVFLPGDLLKTICSIVLITRLRKALSDQWLNIN